MTDRVGAGVDAMQARARQSVRDLVASHAQVDQLTPGNHTVLAPGELGDRPVHLMRVILGHRARQKYTTLAHAPMVAAEMRRGER
jgi:hypothetical protein